MAEKTNTQARKKTGGESGEERSMEDILSSIRRILQEDESEEETPKPQEPSDPEAEASILNVGDISRPQDDEDGDEDDADREEKGEEEADDAAVEEVGATADGDQGEEETEDEESDLLELSDDMVVETPERARPKFEPATAGVDTDADSQTGTVTNFRRKAGVSGTAENKDSDDNDEEGAAAPSGSILAARIAALSSSEEEDDEEAGAGAGADTAVEAGGEVQAGEEEEKEELTAERLLDMELEGTEYDRQPPDADTAQDAPEKEENAPEAANDTTRGDTSDANVIEQIIHLDPEEEQEDGAAQAAGEDARENENDDSGREITMSKEELRPLIDEWIEENLPSLMEKISKR